LETDLRTIQNQLMSAKVEHETLDAEFQLLLREAELRRETARRQAEIDRAIRETSGDRNAELEQLVRKLLELQGQLAARTDSRYALAERSGAEPVTNPNEPVRAGDLLVVEIAGEPDLPREYQVRGDGTIRLPLIGSIRVVGSTANQVREAIAKQITDRGLGKAPGVAVSLRRPRGE
jgi:hypothetical protein